MESKTVFSTTKKDYIKNCPFITFDTGQPLRNAANFIAQICSERSSIYKFNIDNCFQLKCRSPDRKCYICIRQGSNGPDTKVKNFNKGLCEFHDENGEEANKKAKEESPEETTVALFVQELFKKEKEGDCFIDSVKLPVKEVKRMRELLPNQAKILEELKGVASQGKFNKKEHSPKAGANLGLNPHSIMACVSQLIPLGLIERLSKGQYRILDVEYTVKAKKAKTKEKKEKSRKQRTKRVHQLLPRKKVVEEIEKTKNQIEDLKNKQGELESFLVLYDKLTSAIWS